MSTQHGQYLIQLSMKWLAPWHRQHISPDYNPYTTKNGTLISFNNPPSYWQENGSESTVGFATGRASIRRKSHFWRGGILGTRKILNTRTVLAIIQVNIGLSVGFAWCDGKIYRLSECHDNQCADRFRTSGVQKIKGRGQPANPGSPENGS